ncbi:class I SAM-dependent rRNA methyltransferase [Aestuariivivens sediminicola]|uniref:class I SAM-dependent rRNA methyltransferase n=1 Tax=Aestuariivivens sediminicola TaxID=2913560 RepID=UPI001F5AB4CB|nr:class I SAM-dependent rRNA methyltransferase [Aestuariivivens sediminicola]
MFSEKINYKYRTKRIAVKLNSKGEQFVLKGHPWIFSNSITKMNDDAITGDLAVIFSKNKNKVIGLGLYDANSPIRIKMLHSGTDRVVINEAFFERKINEAYNIRLPLLATNTNSYRLLFGENDGFPGLIADVYGQVLVIKLYSEIWWPYLEIILPILLQYTKTQCIVLRLSRQLNQLSNHGLADGEVIFGSMDNEIVEFLEHGVRFSANVIRGHKTGYFLDHRANRKQVGQWSRGKSVLDVFSYAGGFSVHALAQGAKEVTSLDLSEQALDMAVNNGKLNAYNGTHNTIVGDAFEEMDKLIKRNVTFDVVVIDPPSFAKRHSEIELAKRKYAQLAALGEKLTAGNGLLVLASCSSRVSDQTFFDINNHVLTLTKRAFDRILKTGHDIDHPVRFLEGAYLKCGYYRFFDA